MDEEKNALVFPELFPHLETERLILRELRLADREGIFENYSDEEVAMWFFDQPYTDIEQADAVVEAFLKAFTQGTGLTWAITLKEDSRFIGTCGYEHVEVSSQGEIGYDLAKAFWGKGLMNEALSVVIEYGFNMLGLKRVDAHTLIRNERSTRLLERLGFQLAEIKGDSAHFLLAKEAWLSRES